MNIDFFQKVQRALASERLEAYGASQDHALALSRYLWNIAICEALYSPLQMAEVGLRNAIDRSLASKFSRADWYEIAPLCQSQDDGLKEAKGFLLRQRKPLTPGRLIAELHFGFWTAFFNKEHEQTGLAHAVLKNAFPRATKYDRDTTKMRTRWTLVRDLRNRVFHHERIIHWKDLSRQHQDTLELIRWISPELAEVEAKLDRFTPVYTGGLQPWCDKVASFWPKEAPL